MDIEQNTHKHKNKKKGTRYKEDNTLKTWSKVKSVFKKNKSRIENKDIV